MKKIFVLSFLVILCIFIFNGCASGSSFDFDVGGSISKNETLDTAGAVFGFHGRSMGASFIGFDYNFDIIADKNFVKQDTNNQIGIVDNSTSSGIAIAVGPAFRLFQVKERFAMFASPVFRFSMMNMQKPNDNISHFTLESVGGGVNLSSDFYLGTGFHLRIGFDIGAQMDNLKASSSSYSTYEAASENTKLGVRMVMYPRLGIGWYIPKNEPRTQPIQDTPVKNNSFDAKPMPKQSYLIAPWYYRHTDLSGVSGNWTVVQSRDLFNELTGEVSLVYALIDPSYPHSNSTIAITTREFTNELVNSDGSITRRRVVVPDIRFRITNSATDEIGVAVRYESDDGQRMEYHFTGKDEASALGRMFNLSQCTPGFADNQKDYDKYIRPIFDALVNGKDVKIAIVDGYSRHSTFTIEAKGFTLGMKNVYPEMEYDSSFDVDTSR